MQAFDEIDELAVNNLRVLSATRRGSNDVGTVEPTITGRSTAVSMG